MSDTPGRSQATVAVFEFDETITHRNSVIPFLKLVAGTPKLVVGLVDHPVWVTGPLASVATTS